MKLLFWIEDDKSELFQKASMQLAMLYGKITMENFTSSIGVDSCVAGGKELNYVAKEEIKASDYDIILVVGKDVDRNGVLTDCEIYGIDESKVLFDFEVCIPAFTIPKSNKLHHSKISIFSINGWGKRLYQRFHLPYLSPFMDSVMASEDWLTFLMSPQEHLSRDLMLYETITNSDGTKFPVFRMGEEGLKVYMLYETDVEKAKRDWKERIKLINWNDLFIMMYTDFPDMLDRFDRLPYSKKICFTSFESMLDSAFYLPEEKDEDGEDLPLWARVDRLVEGEKPQYDLWDMLLYGKRTRVKYA